MATAIPEPSPSAPPYADAVLEVRQVAETFVRATLEYDAATEWRAAFLDRVGPLATPAELRRLARSPRAHLDWRVLRDRQERVKVTIVGVSVDRAGRVVVAAERTTSTGFATVRDFIQVSLTLVGDGSTLKVADAEGGGL